MKRVYLSGPMSGLPEHNFPAFNAEAARLRALGYAVVNPVDINPDPGTSWHECLRNDLAALLTCDTLALLPGWQGSTGAHLEMHVAHRIAMPIVIAAEIATPGAWRVTDPTVDQVHLDDVKGVLRDLVATIDLHTDCMSNKIDREALDPWIERAEDLLGQTLEEIMS